MKLISYNISHKLPDKAIYIMVSDTKKMIICYRFCCKHLFIAPPLRECAPGQQPSDNIFVDTSITFPYKLWAKYQGKTGDIP